MNYHVKTDGNVFKCRASAGNCPYGGEKDHFPTPEQAREYYEQKQSLPKPVAKKTKAKTVTIRAKIYRSGIMLPPAERGVEKDSYLAADAVKPEGRVGRTEGLFASPNIEGVVRWVKGNAMVNLPDYSVREITIDPTRVYVYSIDAWERASSYFGQKEGYKPYWDTGMTLQDWNERAEKENLNPRDWEVLLKPEDAISVRPVSAKRLSEAARDDYEKDEVLRLFHKARRGRW